MGYLKNTKMYLSSPIEFDDGESNWRPEITQQLHNEFGINVYDPYADEKQKLVPQLNQAVESEDWDEVERISKSFTKRDLGEVDRCDFLIACTPYKVCTTGVPCEVIHAINLKKPVMICCPQGKGKISKWYFGNMKHQYLFGSWNNVFGYLQEVDQGKHKDNHRWWYVYKMV